MTDTPENLFDDVDDARKNDANLFDDLPEAPKKGLDASREVQHVPGADWAGSILAGMNKSNPLLIPPRIGQWLGNKVMSAAGVPGADVHPVSEAISKYLVPNPESTPLHKALQTGGEFGIEVPTLGASLGPLAESLSGAASAMKNAPATYKAMQALKNFGTNAVRDISASPANALKYTGANIASGVGLSAGDQATKDDPWYVHAPAELLGGIAGPSIAGKIAGAPEGALNMWKKVAPAAWAAKLYGDKMAGLLPENSWLGSKLFDIQQNHAKGAYQKAYPLVAEKIQSMGVAPALDEASRLRQTVPGFDPSLAEATGIPSEVANQKSIEQNATGSLLDKFVKRKQSSEEGIRQFTAGMTPNAETDNILPATERRLNEANAPIDAKLNQNRTAQEDLAGQLPNAKAFDVGNYMRDKLEGLRADKQGEMSKLADDLGLNDAVNLRVSRDGLQKAVKSALPSKFAEGTSPTMKQIAKLQAGEPLTFADAKYFMEQLGQEGRQAAKMGNNQDARTIGQARGNIDGYLSDEWAPALGIGDKYKSFRDRYLNEYVNRFDKGAAKDVSALGGDNRYRTDNEDVAGTFFRPGDTTAAHDFHTTFGGDPQALESLHGYALDDLRQKTVKDGVLDTKAMQKWMTANKDNMAEFPTLQQKVGDMHSLATSLAQRQMTLSQRAEAVGNSQLAKTLGNNNATLDTLIANPNMLKRTVSGMTDPEKQAMSRAMWQKATQGADNDPAQMKDFLTKNADVLGATLPKGHVDALNDIQKAWEMNSRTPMPTGRGEEPVIDRFKEVTGSTPQQILSRAFAVMSGRVGKEYTLGDLFIRAGLNTSAKQSRAMLTRAMYDADFAKELSNFVKTDTPNPDQIKRMKGYMFNSGISAMQGDDEDDSN